MPNRTLAFLVNLFFFFFLDLFFLLFKPRVRIEVTRSCCYTSVTSDDMVTVMVTSHKVTEKDIEDSGRIMLYNMCNTC